MKLGIGLKLGFWLALLGIFSTAVTGYYAYYNSRQLLIKASQEKLLTATQVLAHRFTFTLADVDADVRFMAALPQVQQIANGDAEPARTEQSKKQLAGIVSSLLMVHPEYFQIRLIGAKDSGRELVRVDRDETGLSVVSGSNLQEKGHFDYVFESMRLPAGAIYISKINLNRELGAHQGFGKPTIRIATPVRSNDGKTFGIVVINVDLNGMFDQMRSDIAEDTKVLLTNGEGDYLIHPDVSKIFGFDLGRRILIQDDIKETKRILDGKQGNVVLHTDDKDGVEQASAAAFVRVPYGAQGDKRFVVMGLVAPLKNVLSESRALGLSIIKITMLFILLTIAIALILSRVLAYPLNQMARAVSQFSAGKPISDLPVRRTDEIGLLARNFLSMSSKLNAQVTELQDKQLYLDYLAHHDQLTNLPNRLLFLDRLTHAVDKAQRNCEQLAVLFMDLDRFKEINDSLGHFVGDQVLKIAAARLHECVRQQDTISRLGGDEFTIMIEDVHTAADAVVVAEKIIAAFQLPFVVEKHDFIVSCSIGISLYPQHGQQAEELLRNADAAMYQAKELGRNKFQLVGGEEAGGAAVKRAR